MTTFVYYAEDKVAFKEGKHPRDSDGKFTAGSGGSSGSSGGKKSTQKVNPHFSKLLKGSGFTSVAIPKNASNSCIGVYAHSGGAKVYVFESPGAKVGSKWSLNSLNMKKSGHGKADFAKVLGYISTQKSAQKSIQKSATTSTIAPGYKKVYSGPNGDIYKKGSAKVLYNPDTDQWVADTPGYMKKEGKGLTSLNALLAGKSPTSTVGWKDSHKKILTFAQAESTQAAKIAKQKEYAEAKAEQAKWTKEAVPHIAKYKELLKTTPKATPAEAAAVRAYSGSSYQQLNKRLRHQDEDMGGNATTQAIDSYLDKAVLKSTLVTWRGVKGEYAKILKSVMVEGGMFLDRGYMSTTAYREKAWTHGDDSLLMKVTLKKGVKAAPIKGFSANPSEEEVLVARKSVIKVVKFDRKKGYVEVEVDTQL